MSSVRPTGSRPLGFVTLLVAALLIVLVAVPRHDQEGRTAALAPAAFAAHAAPRTAQFALHRGGARKAHRQVFAHYFPPYPISIDNKPPDLDYYAENYLTINGEGGIHRAYGGLLRDRPLGRAPLLGDWRLADMLTEIREAKAAGIDGFTLDILSLSGRTLDIAKTLLKAADIAGDFAIIPNLDASSLGTVAPDRVAATVATLLAHPSADVIGGQHVVSSFLAEAKSVAWWKRVLATLRNRYAMPTKFIAVFNNPSTDNMRAFARFSYGLGSWGYRTAAGAAAAPDLAARAHALGVKWMQAVAVQDARPRAGVYAEAGNTETLRTTWARAIQDGADFVQIATWNDYSETTSVAPSAEHGAAFLLLCAYYSSWFTQGRRPSFVQDHVVLTHRKQRWGAPVSSGIKNMRPILGGTSVRPRNTVEALLFLAAPATVSLHSGHTVRTVHRPAGMSRVLVPLHLGRQRVTIRRGLHLDIRLTSPYRVVREPRVQDMEYVATFK